MQVKVELQVNMQQVEAKVPMQVLMQIQIRDGTTDRCVTLHSEYESISER